MLTAGSRVVFFPSSQRTSTSTRSRVVERKTRLAALFVYLFAPLFRGALCLFPSTGKTPHKIPSPGKQSRQGRPSHDQLAIVAGVPSIMEIFPLNKSFRVDTIRAMAVELGCSWSTFFFFLPFLSPSDRPCLFLGPTKRQARDSLESTVYTTRQQNWCRCNRPQKKRKGSTAFSFLSRSGEFIRLVLHREMSVGARAVC